MVQAGKSQLPRRHWVDSGIGDEGEGTMPQHGGGKSGYKGICLHMKVAKHLIRAPAAKEMDGVRVNVAT